MPTDIDIPKYAIPPHIPPIVTLILVLALDWLAPVPFLSDAVSVGVGIPLFAIGLGIWLWGVSGLVRGGESPDPARATARLVISGPYRFSRNPIYTGGVLGLFGLAVLLNTATGAAVVLALGFLVQNLTVAEERYLAAKFGEEWTAYTRAVRRWI